MFMHPFEHELIHAERAHRFEQLVAHREPREGSRIRRWWYARRSTSTTAQGAAEVGHLVVRPDDRRSGADRRVGDDRRIA